MRISISQSLEFDLYGELDTNEYLPKTDYKFRALCTSDICRMAHRSGKLRTGKRTDTGAVKDVPKNCSVCPDCGEFLFWERT